MDAARPRPTEPLITVSEAARDWITRFRDQHGGEDLALRVEISGISGSDFTYDLFLFRVADAGREDLVFFDDGLAVVVPGRNEPDLRGATVDVAMGPEGPGLTIRNPNRPSPAVVDAIPPLELSGTVGERVAQVIGRHINPRIAVHGGAAELVKVEGDAAHVRLSGGCQGCGMAAMTLRQGIERSIRQAVPEIRQIVDVTEHTAGENPYF